MAFWRCLMHVLAHRRSALSAYALRDILLGCIQVDIPGHAQFSQEFIARQCTRFNIFLSILVNYFKSTCCTERCKINRLGGWILHATPLVCISQVCAKFSPLIYLFCNAVCNVYSCKIARIDKKILKILRHMYCRAMNSCGKRVSPGKSTWMHPKRISLSAYALNALLRWARTCKRHRQNAI